MIGMVVTISGFDPATNEQKDIEHLFEYEDWMYTDRVVLFTQVARDGEKWMKDNCNLDAKSLDEIKLLYC